MALGKARSDACSRMAANGHLSRERSPRCGKADSCRNGNAHAGWVQRVGGVGSRPIAFHFCWTLQRITDGSRPLSSDNELHSARQGTGLQTAPASGLMSGRDHRLGESNQSSFLADRPRSLVCSRASTQTAADRIRPASTRMAAGAPLPPRPDRLGSLDSSLDTAADPSVLGDFSLEPAKAAAGVRSRPCCGCAVRWQLDRLPRQSF